jgi:GNAT superfamily N-acetyltransferase
MDRGAAVYLLVMKGEPVGIVSVNGALIENLYVLPAEQHKGYGTALLKFAIGKCKDPPVLWVLSNNSARDFYEMHGFTATGTTKRLSDHLFEIELRMEANATELP